MKKYNLQLNDLKNRYEYLLDQQNRAYIEFTTHDHIWTLTHTIVPSAYEGQGIASALTRDVLDEALRQGVKIRVMCSYISHWIERHPQYQDLLA